MQRSRRDISKIHSRGGLWAGLYKLGNCEAPPFFSKNFVLFYNYNNNDNVIIAAIIIIYINIHIHKNIWILIWYRYRYRRYYTNIIKCIIC